jgi:hypothetical protein
MLNIGSQALRLQQRHAIAIQTKFQSANCRDFEQLRIGALRPIDQTTWRRQTP